ncbi:hypothetical protein BD309DRAFT_985226, partial [Dichomitus squalens]
ALLKKCSLQVQSFRSVFRLSRSSPVKEPRASPSSHAFSGNNPQREPRGVKRKLEDENVNASEAREVPTLGFRADCLICCHKHYRVVVRETMVNFWCANRETWRATMQHGYERQSLRQRDPGVQCPKIRGNVAMTSRTLHNIGGVVMTGEGDNRLSGMANVKS